MPDQDVWSVDPLGAAPPAKSAQPPKPRVEAAAPKKKAESVWDADPLGATPPAPVQQLDKPAAKKESSGGGNILTQSVGKTLFDTDFASSYKDSAIKKFFDSTIPESVRKTESGNYFGRFMDQIYTMGPDVLDFFTSPAGAALVAAHAIPQARPLAILADYGMAALQGVDAIKSFQEFKNDGSPESLARMVGALAGTYGGVKAGRATGKGIAPSSIEAGRDIKPIREKLEMAGEDAASTAKKEVSLRAEAKALRDSGDTTGAKHAEAQIANLKAAVKAEALDTEAQPKTRAQKIGALFYKLPVLKELGPSLNVPMNDVMAVSADIVRDRAIFEGDQKLTVNRLIHEIKQEVPPEERRIYNVEEGPDGKPKYIPANKIPAVIQGTITADQAGLSPAGREVVKRFKQRDNERIRLMKDLHGEDFKGLDIDNYLTQIWDFGDAKSPTANTGKTLMKDRFLKARQIDDYAAGMEAGLKPKFNDVLDVLKVREEHMIRTIANQRMANSLDKIGGIVGQDKFEQMGLRNWVKLSDSPALERAVYAGKQGDTTFMRYQPVYAHPDIAMAAKAVFGKKFESVPFAALEQLRSFSKKFALSVSFFHHGALSEQSHAIYATRKSPFETAKQTWFVNPEFWKGVRTGLYEVMDKPAPDAPPVIRFKDAAVHDAVQSGLNLQVEDYLSGVVRKLQDVGKDSVGAKKWLTAPVRAIGYVEQVFDRSLWDFYHQGSMLNAFETIKTAEFNKLGKDATPRQVEMMKRAVADHVNNAYGSVSFEQLLMSPKFRQAMNFTMLAPAWTMSNLRVFSQAFENVAGRKLAAQYAGGAAMSWFAASQLMNYAFTSYYGNPDKNGKKGGHFTWDNPGLPLTVYGKQTGLNENNLAIAAGYNPNGQERYIRLGKGLGEPFQWMLDPINTFRGKMSLPLKAAITGISGVDPGTGYPVIDRKSSGWEQTAQATDLFFQGYLPFSARDQLKAIEHKMWPEVFAQPTTSSQFFMMFPTRGGVSYTRAVEAYGRAMEAQDGEAATYILGLARDNKLNPSSIVRAYQDKIRKKLRNAQGPAVTYDRFGNQEEK